MGAVDGPEIASVQPAETPVRRAGEYMHRLRALHWQLTLGRLGVGVAVGWSGDLGHLRGAGSDFA